MIIILKQGAKDDAIDRLRQKMQEKGFVVQDIQGENTHMLGLAGDTSTLTEDMFAREDIVESTVRVREPYKLAGRRFHPENTVIDVGGRKIGDGSFSVMAGPC